MKKPNKLVYILLVAGIIGLCWLLYTAVQGPRIQVGRILDKQVISGPEHHGTKVYQVKISLCDSKKTKVFFLENPAEFNSLKRDMLIKFEIKRAGSSMNIISGSAMLKNMIRSLGK